MAMSGPNKPPGLFEMAGWLSGSGNKQPAQHVLPNNAMQPRHHIASDSAMQKNPALSLSGDTELYGGMDPYWLQGGAPEFSEPEIDPYWTQGGEPEFSSPSFADSLDWNSFDWDGYGSGSGGSSGLAGLGSLGGIGAAQSVGAGVTQPTQQTAIAPNGVSWWNQQFRPQASMQQGLNSWLLGNYMNKPGEMAQQATDAIGSQLNMNADRNHQRGMLNDILNAVGNIGQSSGPRMQGFQDIRTGQGAALPGTTQSSITAGQLGAPRIQQAVATARGGGGDRSAPTAGLRIPAGAQAELDQRYATSMTNQGNQNATELDRYAAGQNAGLKRGAEVAAGGQGNRNAQWLINQNTANVANDSRTKNALLRFGMRQGGFA